MAPILSLLSSPAKLLARTVISSSDVRAQWTNPSNIADILLLVGGDVVRVALAQLSGSNWLTPVPFSFGWVAYSFSALVSAFGDKKLMPPPDIPSIVINADTGYVRNNQSWLLGRLLRDFEDGHWMNPENKKDLNAMLRNVQNGDTRSSSSPRELIPKACLCISVYEADPSLKARRIVPGVLFWLGYGVAILQLIIASLPLIIWRNGDYSALAITFGGTCLAFTMGNLRQWRSERYSCRPRSKKAFVLTRGNGAQHALVILGQGNGLDLEDLASSREAHQASVGTRSLIFVFAILWVALLITVDGLRNHTWFIVAVGGLGSFYTTLVAGLQQTPEQVGIPLKWTGKCFVNKKVMVSLIEAEKYRTGLGRAMLETFFPGPRTHEEDIFWEQAKKLQLLKNPPPKTETVIKAARAGTLDIKTEIAQYTTST